MTRNSVIGEKWIEFEGKRVKVKICKEGNALGCDDLNRWRKSPTRVAPSSRGVLVPFG